MADVLTPEQRRLNMSRIQGKDSKLEMLIRRGLHEQGLRYRLHARSLPGTPDLVFSSQRVALFVHGCFWHKHECKFSRIPTTRREFWASKLQKNVERDTLVTSQLMNNGWRVIVIWECAFRSQSREAIETALATISSEIRTGTTPFREFPSRT
ncbi:very short patch repair endonuclease [Roseateles sp.]|uniref:very short patch repair endonuclease n=1 Tax=Roseateles sp. TaxID=1971397 RepID=UPI0031D65A53